MKPLQLGKKKTLEVQVGSIIIGGDNPVAIQSMTNTATYDVESTVAQAKQLADAGSELVRVTVNTPDSAEAIPEIRKRLDEDGYAHIPLVGDFHFTGHLLLKRFPACAEALDKYRINPGNVGTGDKRDENFSEIVKMAIQYNKPVRIGVNFGSLDQDLFTKMMEENAKLGDKALSDREVVRNAMVTSAMQSADLAESLGLASNKIILSVKMAELPEMVAAYKALHEECKKRNKMYPLHLGLTEAGPGMKGTVASSAALGILLHQGIGDTIRVSLTPTPDTDRADEVRVCTYLLQSLGLRSFKPMITSCPGCGRTTNTFYQKMAKEMSEYIDLRTKEWREQYPGVETLKVAIMGCIVNGPGESRDADIGISLPGDMEKPVAEVYKDGEKIMVLREEATILDEFKQFFEDYIQERFG